MKSEKENIKNLRWRTRYFKSLNDVTGSEKRTKKSKYKLVYEFESNKYLTRKKDTHKLNYLPVSVTELLIDIDNGDNVESALKDTYTIKDYLEKTYNATTNIYFSGKKGFHIQIPFKNRLVLKSLNLADKDTNVIKTYELFLNELKNNLSIKSELDNSLAQVTRIITLPNIKKEDDYKNGRFIYRDGRGYKILCNGSKDLKYIFEQSGENKDIGEYNTADNKELYDHLHEIDNNCEETTLIESTDQHNQNQEKTDELDQKNNSKYECYTKVFNDLDAKMSTHELIGIIGSSLNGYFSIKEVEKIYSILAETTDIETSSNPKLSFINGYKNDKMPFNVGAIYNAYEKNKIEDMGNFYELSDFLKQIQEKIRFKEVNTIMGEYTNCLEMLEDKLYDYVDNTENIFKGIINALSALYGYGSRFIVVNGGAEVGKSEYIKTIKQLMPEFNNLGSSTPASIRRASEQEFNKKIVYLGDKGLKGKDEEFKGLQEVFGGLITENEFIRDVVVGEKVMKFNLKSDGVCVFYTEPYTNLRMFGAGEQYTTRSTFITINPVEDGLKLFLQDETKENTFYGKHTDYISHIIRNPLAIEISNEIKTKLFESSKKSLRTAKYLLALFKAYAQYMRIEKPSTQDADEFLKIFKTGIDITEIEKLVYAKLYKNLKTLPADEIEYKFADDGSILYEDMLTQVNNRSEKCFFTSKQIKTYFKNDFKQNKNLKDVIDDIPEILNNLYTADYIEKIDWQYNGQNVYYIPKNEQME